MADIWKLAACRWIGRFVDIEFLVLLEDRVARCHWVLLLRGGYGSLWAGGVAMVRAG